MYPNIVSPLIAGSRFFGNQNKGDSSSAPSCNASVSSLVHVTPVSDILSITWIEVVEEVAA